MSGHPFIRQGLSTTICATGQTLPCAHTSTRVHTVRRLHSTAHDTKKMHPPASIPPCSLLPDPCVAQTPTDRTRHLTDVLRYTHTHAATHTHSWSQLALRAEPVGIELCISLSLSLSALSWFAAHRRRRAGRVSPSALKIGPPRVLGTKIQISPSSSQLELALFPGACREGRLWHLLKK